MAVKGILFDFWGTLVENGVYPSPVSQVRYFLRLKDLRFHDYIVRFENAFMTREYGSLTEGFSAVCQEFKVNPPDWVIDKMVGMWNKNRLLAKPFPETEKVLSELKKRYKIALISNTDAFSVEPLIERFGFGAYFDSITLSYKEGKLKVDKGLYEQALLGIGLSAEEVVMVGDSVESDMISAESAGIRSVLVDRRNKREYSPKILSLTELADHLG